MDLVDVYEAVVPSTVAFISKFVRLAPGSESPLLPPIIGTGFLVSEDGIVATNRHVAEALQGIPSNPHTGEDGYGAVMFDMRKDGDGGVTMQWMMPDVYAVAMLDNFTSDATWFGEDKPDLAFVQLKIRGTPFLKLADDDFYIRPGTPIATVGFPMGDLPLRVMNRVNQAAPFIRRGIVSSVYPFSIPRPHGFTIDIMQQGGSSGSPILYEGEPTVVGMMAAGMLQPAPLKIGNTILAVPVPTNISIAVSSHMIKLAFPTFKETEYWTDPSEFPTVEEWKRTHTAKDTLGWDRYEL